MAAIEERIVRNYFEHHGFFVRHLETLSATGRKRAAEETTAVLVFNPHVGPQRPPPEFLVFANELSAIEQAVVILPAGRSWRFTPATLKSSQRLFRFLEKAFAKGPPPGVSLDLEEVDDKTRRLLVLPTFPSAEPFRSRTKELLQPTGVDGILSFRSMLLEVIARVAPDEKEERSELLEMIRVLKNYDLIKDSQLELFGRRDE